MTYLIAPQSALGVYSQYNYMRPGFISKLKRRRFEVALRLAKPWLGTTVIDMGCADGFLLPSLSKYFSQVYAVDNNAEAIAEAERLTESAQLGNVEIICNASGELRVPKCRVMFLLETLEHVGEKERLPESKADFVRYCFSLLSADGVIIASVPRMTGWSFLLKYIMQSLVGRAHEHFTVSELIASALGNTDRLEQQWNHNHKGFNERKLSKALRDNFNVTQHDTMTSVFYVIRNRG